MSLTKVPGIQVAFEYFEKELRHLKSLQFINICDKIFFLWYPAEILQSDGTHGETQMWYW